MSLNQKIRDVAIKKARFTAADVCDALNVKTFAQAAKVRDAIGDLRRQKEILSIRPGEYLFIPKDRAWTKLDIIWHLVRSHTSFTTDDIERLSGASRITVLEYLHCLKKIGALRHTPRSKTWVLVCDLGPKTPVNAAKCRRLRLRRAAERRGG